MANLSSKQVTAILSDISEYIDTASAGVGLATQAIKEFHDKVPLEDLFNGIRDWLVSDFGPTAKQIYNWWWELCTDSTWKYATLYQSLINGTDKLPGIDAHVALALVLQQMSNDKAAMSAIIERIGKSNSDHGIGTKK